MFQIIVQYHYHLILKNNGKINVQQNLQILNDSSLIYPLRFDFRQKYSTFHVPINFNKELSKNVDKENTRCDILFIFKSFWFCCAWFLLAKLEHNYIYAIANDWCKSSIFDIEQFVSINIYILNQVSVKYGIPEGLVLGTLLSLIIINNLNKTRFNKYKCWFEKSNWLAKY